MDDFRILTDSTSDLSQQMVDELDVTVIPMDFTIGSDAFKDYPDDRSISAHAFYTRIAAGEPSTTTQISVVTFTETFEPFLKEGKDVLYLAFSSGLSGTYNNSVVAAQQLSQKYPDRKIYTVDTRAASLGEGLLVWYAVQMKRAGRSIDEVRDWEERSRCRMHHWFTVNDLNHLKRGGRISGASALVGSVLGIKPVLHFDDEGHIRLVDKIRGRRQSLDDMVRHMERTAEDPQKQMIFISDGDSPEAAEYVKEKVAEKFGVERFGKASIGPVIGAHTGTGTIALFYLGKDREYEQTESARTARRGGVSPQAPTEPVSARRRER
ncbi:MAG TPA: fatty acid-binding protein DegV [Ruminococcaceae bacterium]|jgi:DegV family protein with EDD domain|nr:fatty acid-binding protein DegV [Oscillospiraceae bacterium]